MNFNGAEDEYFYTRYLCWSPNDNFILELGSGRIELQRSQSSQSITAAAIGTATGWCLGPYLPRAC